MCVCEHCNYFAREDVKHCESYGSVACQSCICVVIVIYELHEVNSTTLVDATNALPTACGDLVPASSYMETAQQ